MKYIILIAVALLIGFSFGKFNTNIQSGKGNSDTAVGETLLEFRPIETMGTTEAEQKKIERLIETFEGYKLQKDPDKLLEMFTPPESKDEQDTLDSLLGKDYAQGSTKPLPRLFSTQGYNHSIGGHYVRDIKKKSNSIIVAVDELRIFYIGLSEDFVGYRAKVVGLAFELTETSDGYMIKRYYHSELNGKDPAKYDGFSAE